ncbi:hypothetical protein RJZ56_003572 [Blastomyces dermatitidis]
MGAERGDVDAILLESNFELALNLHARNDSREKPAKVQRRVASYLASQTVVLVQGTQNLTRSSNVSLTHKQIPKLQFVRLFARILDQTAGPWLPRYHGSKTPRVDIGPGTANFSEIAGHA